MDNATRVALEQLADNLESIARMPMTREHIEHMSRIAPREAVDLYSIAWQIKQVARWGTPSFGV